MTNLEMLRRYEEAEQLAQCVLISSDSPEQFSRDRIAPMLRVNRDLRVCISCGADQLHDGTLPCGH